MENKTTLFMHLPLGARFRYMGGAEVWVVLERHGCGKIAKWEGNLLDFAWQTICSAGDTELAVESLRVILLLDAAKSSGVEGVRS